ncbi:hypothetical protein [Halorarius litoreus]|nr:hypothetical protein [Halorarius litoreus]
MALENDPVRDPSAVVRDVQLGDGELIVYDAAVETAWIQGRAVTVER